MANNRFQIYCKKCLEMDTFAKYYCDFWEVRSNAVEILNSFLEKHSDCHKITFLGEDYFGFRTENDEKKDGFHTDYSKKPFKLKIGVSEKIKIYHKITMHDPYLFDFRIKLSLHEDFTDSMTVILDPNNLFSILKDTIDGVNYILNNKK